MTTLHDRLADLADHVDLSPAPAPDLWRQGRRYRRRRAATTAATVLAVGLVAAVGVAGLAARSAERIDPAAPEERTVLPDRFFVPDGQLPVDRDGTGPLVALMPAEHFSWTSQGKQGLVGVSAVTQEYAFLDLPGWIGDHGSGESWSLSTNGRWVAYWYGDRQEVSGELPADGIAVLDAATGEVRRYDLRSQLGVQPHRVAWAGDTLYFTKWDYTEINENSSAGNLVASYVWDLGEAQPHEVDDPHRLLFDPLGPAREDGFLTVARGDRWFVVATEADLTGERVARISIKSLQPDAAALSPDGRTVAIAQAQESGARARILTGTVAGDDTHATFLGADLGQYPYLLGWLDDRSLAVEVSEDDERRLVAVDVMTGQLRTLSTFEQPQHDTAQYAADLLRSPVVGAVAPPDPVDPRLVALGTLALVLLFAVGLGWWRRRARR